MSSSFCMVVAVASIAVAECLQGAKVAPGHVCEASRPLLAGEATEGVSFLQLSKVSQLDTKHQGTRLSQPKPGNMGGILPPVQVEGDVAKLETVSKPGIWQTYYKVAEADMDKQWSNFIFPMIRSSDFTSVLEVAAGACRNTEKLVPFSGSLLATDIDPAAVNSCKKRFAGRATSNTNVSFAAVDGVHLPVENGSVSLIYQFDSGVHFHRKVIQQYLHEFSRVLRPGGTGFFHHSNLADSRFPVEDDLDVTNNAAWRSNMTRSLFEDYAKEAGLEMMCHPLVDWSTDLPNIDAFARFRKPGGSSSTILHDICPSHVRAGAGRKALVLEPKTQLDVRRQRPKSSAKHAKQRDAD